MPKVDPDLVEYWRDVARRLTAAAHSEQTAIVRAAAAAVGIHPSTAYKRLADFAGWTSGRKRRADAGSSRQAVATVELVAAMRRECTRANGKRIMPAGVAMGIAEQNGHEIRVGRSQFHRLMRAQRLDYATQDAADTHPGQMRSLYPNHVHEVDPSLCVLYYMHGKQQMMRAAEFYKNKLDAFYKVKLKCWRYVRTDHASSVIDVHYVESAGESAANMADFLIYTWGKVPGRSHHGVPQILLWDKGSANIARPVQSLLEALEVESITHAAEASWVKGQVEGAQQIVETHFESRLRIEPVDSVEQLNASALAFCEAWNANAIPHVDSRLHREGIPPIARLDLWMRIRPQQLRELPPADVCRALAEGRVEERTVTARRRIEFAHPQASLKTVYDVRGCEGLVPGDKVDVVPLLTGHCAIRVRWKTPIGDERVWRIEPETEYDEWGRPLSGPVIGQNYHALPKSAAVANMDKLDALAYPGVDNPEEARRKQVTPFGGELRAHSYLADLATPNYMPRSGTAIAATAPEDASVPVPVTRALLTLRSALGRPLTRDENRWLAERWPHGIPERDLDRLCATEIDDIREAAC